MLICKLIMGLNFNFSYSNFLSVCVYLLFNFSYMFMGIYPHSANN